MTQSTKPTPVDLNNIVDRKLEAQLLVRSLTKRALPNDAHKAMTVDKDRVKSRELFAADPENTKNLELVMPEILGLVSLIMDVADMDALTTDMGDHTLDIQMDFKPEE